MDDLYRSDSKLKSSAGRGCSPQGWEGGAQLVLGLAGEYASRRTELIELVLDVPGTWGGRWQGGADIASARYI